SSAIIVHVSRGKNAWHFVDSYWLMRDSLANIGKWIGLEKGEKEDKKIFYAPISELKIYNERDCIILYQAVQQFEIALLDLGGELKMTQASCALNLFRRAFLRSEIVTHRRVNEICRQAYFASRV